MAGYGYEFVKSGMRCEHRAQNLGPKNLHKFYGFSKKNYTILLQTCGQNLEPDSADWQEKATKLKCDQHSSTVKLTTNQQNRDIHPFPFHRLLMWNGINHHQPKHHFLKWKMEGNFANFCHKLFDEFLKRKFSMASALCPVTVGVD